MPTINRCRRSCGRRRENDYISTKACRFRNAFNNRISNVDAPFIFVVVIKTRFEIAAGTDWVSNKPTGLKTVIVSTLDRLVDRHIRYYSLCSNVKLTSNVETDKSLILFWRNTKY